MRENHFNANLFDAMVNRGFKLASLTFTATAELEVQASWPPVLYADPGGGARTILLPAEEDSKDLVFFVRNIADAAEVLTIEEDSSTTAIVALAQNEGCMLHCDGTTWRAFQNDIA